ncbi:MAG: lipase family protein [Methylocella sp.]
MYFPNGFSRDDALACATLVDVDAFLAFRGTTSAWDGYMNSRFYQTDYAFAPDHGRVHDGFANIYTLLRQQVLDAVKALRSVSRLVFTGHSLGCALSSLAIPDVLRNSPPLLPKLHYNFASPRVGDPQFAFKMNTSGVPTFRVVNTEDIVPATPLPVSVWPSDLSTYLYKHIGTPIDFTAQYDTIYNNHSLNIAYQYALTNPNNPEGPLPRLLRRASPVDAGALLPLQAIRVGQSA